MDKLEKVISNNIEISETEIRELSKKLTDKQVKEFAEDYGLSIEKARHDLAEYILFNIKYNG